MIEDFDIAQRRFGTYSGANGKKLAIFLDGERWFVKLPPRSTRPNAPRSYRNSCITEYIGCKAFECAGVPVQETRLGTITIHGERRIAVACRDFTEPGIILGDFIGVKNSAIDSSRSGHDTELDSVLEAIEMQDLVDPAELTERFWDMFVVDSLIANNDRHNGNWGILTSDTSASIAPVFDCGGCLVPDLDDTTMRAVLGEERQILSYALAKPNTAIKLNGRHRSYAEFFELCDDHNLDEALLRIVPSIDTQALFSHIDAISILSDTQRQFYNAVLESRMSNLVIPAYENAALRRQRDMSRVHPLENDMRIAREEAESTSRGLSNDSTRRFGRNR